MRVGDSVALVPGYSPSTVNWYDAYHVISDDVVVDVWPIVLFPTGVPFMLRYIQLIGTMRMVWLPVKSTKPVNCCSSVGSPGWGSGSR